jgi:3-deoxy-D-manno-octulosonic-acid transferase
MSAAIPPLPAGLRIRCEDPNLTETVHLVASRLHALTLSSLGASCGPIELVVERGDIRQGPRPHFANAVHAHLSVRLGRGRGAILVNASHRDEDHAITQAFARAQRELLRRLSTLSPRHRPSPPGNF